MAGLSIEQRRLIEALSRNDITDSKKYAIYMMQGDKTKKNDSFIENYTKLLSDKNDLIPENLKYKIIGQFPEDFDKGRYYLSSREKLLLDNIVKMKAVANKMDELHIGYTNTVLLYGLPGVGKTMFGKYVAHKLNLPFYYINFSTMIDSYMGATSKNINLIFEYIKQLQCVFMLDELDCIAMKRKRGGQTGVDGELERTTISIMQEFDRLSNNVVIIAATNRLDIIDDALLQRFSIKHEIVAFTTEENIDMINMFLESTGTKKYIEEKDITEIIFMEKYQRNIMSAVIRKIGNKMYNEL